jgi:hypothetical protein
VATLHCNPAQQSVLSAQVPVEAAFMQHFFGLPSQDMLSQHCEAELHAMLLSWHITHLPAWLQSEPEQHVPWSGPPLQEKERLPGGTQQAPPAQFSPLWQHGGGVVEQAPPGPTVQL